MIAQSWYGAPSAVDLARVEDALIAAAADPQDIVRLAAVRGLGVIGPKVGDDPPAVLPSALEDESVKVRAAAAEALARFPRGLPRILPSLVRSFEKAPPEVRASYTAVFDRIRPRTFTAEAVLALASVLASPDAEVRYLAATALAAFGDRAYPAIPALIATLRRPGREDGRASALVEDRDPVLAAAQALIRIVPEPPFLSRPRPPVDPESLVALARAPLGNTASPGGDRRCPGPVPTHAGGHPCAGRSGG